MYQQIKFIDAFKVTDAPYAIQEGAYSDRKVYLPEAYTAAYMIPSDVTGKLCRWLVVIDGKKISVLQHYCVKASKNETKTMFNVLYNMGGMNGGKDKHGWYTEKGREERIALIQTLYSFLSATTRKEAEEVAICYDRGKTCSAQERDMINMISINFFGLLVEAIFRNGINA